MLQPNLHPFDFNGNFLAIALSRNSIFCTEIDLL